jgi:thiosulfate/3-mercaptopyruvate sulfurtransferase
MNGRHPLPDPQRLGRTFGNWGISAAVQVVAYDQDAGAYASRLWWMLRWLGHDDAAVLDGGFAKWTREGREIEPGWRPVPSSRVFTPSLRANMVVPVEEMAGLAGDPAVRVVDARAPERYLGTVETIDKVAGHIPGATNYPFRRNVRDDGTFRSGAELAENWARTARGVRPENLVCYCGSGVTACQNILALEHAGIKGARLYAGSWSEWSSDPSRPTARGPEEP